eukprot:TRINITY_DN6590_c0_g1_i7.p2 TRINITY_DN6590_c0_g1~~TRINITY_DN6590_c0_g1_i7.p2  ORF type:complete len:150 (+),score=12.98 TRINITY_DN6590_c0_g1_i7:309-758(+)
MDIYLVINSCIRFDQSCFYSLVIDILELVYWLSFMMDLMVSSRLCIKLFYSLVLVISEVGLLVRFYDRLDSQLNIIECGKTFRLILQLFLVLNITMAGNSGQWHLNIDCWINGSSILFIVGFQGFEGVVVVSQFLLSKKKKKKIGEAPF